MMLFAKSRQICVELELYSIIMAHIRCNLSIFEVLL